MTAKAHDLRGMLTVRFPRPAWQTGKPKADADKANKPRRGKTTDALGLRRQSLSRLTEGVPADVVESVIAGVDGDPAKAAARLERLREPDMTKVSVEQPSTLLL